MIRSRTIWVVATLLVGGLQAWDSGAFQAGPTVVGLVALAILAPATAIGLSVDHGVRIAALVAGAVLLTWARMIAPEPLNTLHIALFPPALYILFVHRMTGAPLAREGR